MSKIMLKKNSYLTFAFGCLVALSACSKTKEQCHALTLAVTEADNAYVELSAAAGRGQRAPFDKASKDFESALTKVSALEFSGSGPRESGYARTKQRYLEAAPKIVPAYQHLLEAVEKNPGLGQKHQGGVAFLRSTDDVPKDVEQADSTIKVVGSNTRKLDCN
ncbi:MAG TPA: hypothetical protein PKI03_22365 [Pseudomonadota bacterium]|nr:hypothetical protein [Pseudomonadota bacterium]